MHTYIYIYIYIYIYKHIQNNQYTQIDITKYGINDDWISLSCGLRGARPSARARWSLFVIFFHIWCCFPKAEAVVVTEAVQGIPSSNEQKQLSRQNKWWWKRLRLPSRQCKRSGQSKRARAQPSGQALPQSVVAPIMYVLPSLSWGKPEQQVCAFGNFAGSDLGTYVGVFGVGIPQNHYRSYALSFGNKCLLHIHDLCCCIWCVHIKASFNLLGYNI